MLSYKRNFHYLCTISGEFPICSQCYLNSGGKKVNHGKWRKKQRHVADMLEQ